MCFMPRQFVGLSFNTLKPPKAELEGVMLRYIERRIEAILAEWMQEKGLLQNLRMTTHDIQ